MFNNNVSEEKALVFDDRKITNEEENPNDPGRMMFLQKKKIEVRKFKIPQSMSVLQN